MVSPIGDCRTTLVESRIASETDSENGQPEGASQPFALAAAVACRAAHWTQPCLLPFILAAGVQTSWSSGIRPEGRFARRSIQWLDLLQGA